MQTEICLSTIDEMCTIMRDIAADASSDESTSYAFYLAFEMGKTQQFLEHLGLCLCKVEYCTETYHDTPDATLAKSNRLLMKNSKGWMLKTGLDVLNSYKYETSTQITDLLSPNECLLIQPVGSLLMERIYIDKKLKYFDFNVHIDSILLNYNEAGSYFYPIATISATKSQLAQAIQFFENAKISVARTSCPLFSLIILTERGMVLFDNQECKAEPIFKNRNFVDAIMKLCLTGPLIELKNVTNEPDHYCLIKSY